MAGGAGQSDVAGEVNVAQGDTSHLRRGENLVPGLRETGAMMDRNRRGDVAPKAFGGLRTAREFVRVTSVSVRWWRAFG